MTLTAARRGCRRPTRRRTPASTATRTPPTASCRTCSCAAPPRRALRPAQGLARLLRCACMRPCSCTLSGVQARVWPRAVLTCAVSGLHCARFHLARASACPACGGRSSGRMHCPHHGCMPGQQAQRACGRHAAARAPACRPCPRRAGHRAGRARAQAGAGQAPPRVPGVLPRHPAGQRALAVRHARQRHGRNPRPCPSVETLDIIPPVERSPEGLRRTV